MGSHKMLAYSSYINSPEWGSKCKEYYDAFGVYCRSKGCDEVAEEVHHHTYIRFKNEDLKDLVGLCKRHHKEIHDLHRSQKGSLTSVTEKVTGLSLRKHKKVQKKTVRSKTSMSSLEARHKKSPPKTPCKCRTCKARSVDF